MLCCEAQPELATTPAINIIQRSPRKTDVPELSVSVDSAVSDASDRDDQAEASASRPVDIASTSNSEDSIQCVSRGREKHITSIDLEKMVSDIQEQEGQPWPLPSSITDAMPPIPPCADITPRPASPSMRTSIRSTESSTSTAPRSSPESDCSTVESISSDTSNEVHASAPHSVVRGFALNVSSSYRSNTHLAAPQTVAKPIQHTKANDPKKHKVAFSLGAGSSGDEGSSFEESMSGKHPRQSSLTAGLQLPLHGRKQTSFDDELKLRAKSQQHEDVFEDSDDDDEESAIEDDDENDDEDGSDWEDDGSEAGEAVDDKPLFQRIDSKPNLVSRRSLLTTMMNESDRAAAFQNMATHSTPALRRSRRSSPNGPSLGDTPEENPNITLPPTMTKSKPIIMTTSNTHPPALSPRTTRRNMLASEMTESLRKHLLWERQQISTTAKAVLKRRHTAYDITKLSEYPSDKEGQTSKNSSWNHFYDQNNDFNQAGW